MIFYNRRKFIGLSTAAAATALASCAPAIPALADIELISVISSVATLFVGFKRNVLGLARDFSVGLSTNAAYDILKSKWTRSDGELARLVKSAQAANADLRLAVEAAKIIGADTMIEYFESKTNIWYQFNVEETPINAFSYNIKTTGVDNVTGNIVFQIRDALTGNIDMPPFETEGFRMVGNGTFSDTLPVNIRNLPSSGHKTVEVIQKPDRVEVTTSKLVVLALSP